jgi:hypothetical protein
MSGCPISAAARLGNEWVSDFGTNLLGMEGILDGHVFSMARDEFGAFPTSCQHRRKQSNRPLDFRKDIGRSWQTSLSDEE